jgi:hypothetical protein
MVVESYYAMDEEAATRSWGKLRQGVASLVWRGIESGIGERIDSVALSISLVHYSSTKDAKLPA